MGKLTGLNGPTVHRKMTVDGWRVDTSQIYTCKNGKEVKLPARETALLLYLAGNAGRIVSLDDISYHVWERAMTDAAIVNCVYSIKKRLQSLSLIVTVHKRGYMMPESKVNQERLPADALFTGYMTAFINSL